LETKRWNHSRHGPDNPKSVASNAAKLARTLYENYDDAISPAEAERALLQPSANLLDSSERNLHYYNDYKNQRYAYVDMRRREGISSFHVAAVMNGNLNRLYQHLPGK